MSNKPGTAGPLLFATVFLLVVLPLLYVLSCGPAAWLVTRGYASAETADVIYAPLNCACENCEPFGLAVYWYQDKFYPMEFTEQIPPQTFYEPSLPAGVSP